MLEEALRLAALCGGAQTPAAPAARARSISSTPARAPIRSTSTLGGAQLKPVAMIMSMPVIVSVTSPTRWKA